ncbi:SPFH domain-containing protein [Marinicrinis sediminis]|uniref:SPFH domain-containing protein n=1 Tax=Marinicrinis sediminis TaxID=1652465 RepID=A0ABW5RB07_9BACL
MGIVRAAFSALSGGLADQWLEVIEPQEMTGTTVVTPGVKVRAKDARDRNRKGTDTTVSNGSVIHVHPNQFMLLLDGGKIVDYTAEAGYYKVDQSSMPSLFNGEFGEALKDTFSRIQFGGASSKAQKVYFINLQEIKGIKFGTRNPVNYFDHFYNAELFLRTHGTYSIRIVDPLKFFAEAIPRNQAHVEIADINEQYLNEFLTALQSAINRMSQDGIRISHVTSKSVELARYMADVLDTDWSQLRGMEVQAVGINSISYDEQSQQLIHMRNQGAMLQDPSIRDGYVQGSIARGLESAGSNEAGAMTGFMGVGMGMQGAGTFMQGVSATNREAMQQQQAQQARQASGSPAKGKTQSAETWTCSCGTDNEGRFCTACGRSKQENLSETWNCACGHENDGKFCTDCGAKKPERLQCDKCGFTPADTSISYKFCPECGDPFDQADRASS